MVSARSLWAGRSNVPPRLRGSDGRNWIEGVAFEDCANRPNHVSKGGWDLALGMTQHSNMCLHLMAWIS